MTVVDNLKLTAKTILPLAVMATLFAGVVGYGVTRYQTVTSEYRTLSTQTVPGALRLIRMNQSVLVIPYSIYRLAGLTCSGADAATCKQTADEFKAAISFAVKNIDEAKEVDRSRTAEYEVFKQRFLAMVEAATPALQSALAGDMPRALAAIAPVAEKMIPLRNDVRLFSASTLEHADQRAGKLSSVSDELFLTMAILGACAILVGISISCWMSIAKIARPLGLLQNRMRGLADGDLSVAIEGVKRRDEIGAMARAVQVFKDNSLRAKTLESEAANLRQQAEQAQQRETQLQQEDAAGNEVTIRALADGLDALSNGNLVHQIDATFPAKTQQLKEDFNRTAASLRETVGTITGAILGMSNGTSEISQAAEDLSRRTEQQAASLEKTAAALDQITTTVRRTAEGAKQARDVVSRTRSEAERSGEVVRQAVTAMSGIEQSSQQIGQIIGVIDEIAFQTNLLALNAGVEAARAGDAGRGFAVVASEVRALAQRSAEAAREIKVLISTSAQQVDAGVQLVGETGQALERIQTQVSAITNVISDIAASAQDQAAGLAEVNTAINQMDQVTQQNAAMVEQSTAASHTLAQEAQELARLTSRFQLDPEADIGRPIAPRPRASVVPFRPAAPARATSRRSQRAVSGRAAAEAPKQDGWEEF